MSQDASLHNALEQFARQEQADLTTGGLDESLPSSAGDLFLNDYLSLAADTALRERSRRQALAAPLLFSATSSHLSTGNSKGYNALERRLQRFFGYPAALLFHPGHNASATFFTSVPQEGDIIIYDELSHTSWREGFRTSARRRVTYRFAHNSVASLKECIWNVLRKHPQITQGNSTVFVYLESLYGMQGDFCPLVEMVEVIEKLIPAGRSHIVVDEAHTSAICGPNGSGYVSLLGLNDRVHTVVHTFGQAWGFHGGVILSSAKVRESLVLSAEHTVFSPALSYTDINGLQSRLNIISGDRGEKLRQRLNEVCRYAHKHLLSALKHIPEGILSVEHLSLETGVRRDLGLYSPVIPIYTPLAGSLSNYLLEKGYSASAITHRAVKKPMVRMSVHVSNKEADIDSFIETVVQWATKHAQDGVRSVGHSESGYVEKARL
ncbi:8-amino-7-oxononanoate synthase [Paxillus ammoniavirescens]|nr:8-amino-7-oxononanoate synthase [Paxillus ammoniavirescens]